MLFESFHKVFKEIKYGFIGSLPALLDFRGKFLSLSFLGGKFQK